MSHTTHPPNFQLGIVLPLFLAGVSLLLSVLIFSEIFLSYADRALSLYSSPSSQHSDALEVTHKLENLEWHVRAHSSALAFGAFVFVWYQIFIALFHLCVGLWRCWRPAGTDVETERRERYQCHGRRGSSYVGFLLTAIILNDSIYNRCRDSVSAGCSIDPSPTLTLSNLFPPSYSAILTLLRQILPDALARFSSMASRSLPICAAEVSVLFLVLYTIGMLFPDTNSHLNSSRSNSRSASGGCSGLPTHTGTATGTAHVVSEGSLLALESSAHVLHSDLKTVQVLDEIVIVECKEAWRDGL